MYAKRLAASYARLLNEVGDTTAVEPVLRAAEHESEFDSVVHRPEICAYLKCQRRTRVSSRGVIAWCRE